MYEHELPLPINRNNFSCALSTLISLLTLTYDRIVVCPNFLDTVFHRLNWQRKMYLMFSSWSYCSFVFNSLVSFVCILVASKLALFISYFTSFELNTLTHVFINFVFPLIVWCLESSLWYWLHKLLFALLITKINFVRSTKACYLNHNVLHSYFMIFHPVIFIIFQKQRQHYLTQRLQSRFASNIERDLYVVNRPMWHYNRKDNHLKSMKQSKLNYFFHKYTLLSTYVGSIKVYACANVLSEINKLF